MRSIIGLEFRDHRSINNVFLVPDYVGLLDSYKLIKGISSKKSEKKT